jgi:hypothetical protein
MSNVLGDLGYGWTKGLSEGKTFFQPSVVGDARQLMDEQRKPGDLIYHGDDGDFFVGDLALRQSKIRYTSTGEDKTDTWTTAVLLKTLLARLSPNGASNVVTGLPVDYYLTQKNGFVHLFDAINESGHYSVEVVGQGTIHANPLIAKHKIVPQPFGSAMDYLLADDGSLARPDIAKKPMLVIDIGYYTLDLLELEAMEIGKNSRSPRNLGVDTAYDLLNGYLMESIGRAPERFELDRYVLAGEYAGYDIKPLVDRAFRSLAQQILLEIESQSAYYATYLLTGGSASFVAKYIDLPNVVVLDNPQFGNVRGYGKIGARLWANKSVSVRR